MKNSLINNKNLVATSIAAAILAITGATVAVNRVNNGEFMMACPNYPYCYSPDSQDFEQPETTSQKENDRSVATANSKKLYLS